MITFPLFTYVFFCPFIVLQLNFLSIFLTHLLLPLFLFLAAFCLILASLVLCCFRTFSSAMYDVVLIALLPRTKCATSCSLTKCALHKGFVVRGRC